MDAFIKSTRSTPALLFQSSEIKDRDSTFIGSIYRAASLTEVKAAINHHKYVIHAARKASHEMAAWRLMVTKSGRDGLGGPDDFEVQSGSDDDGEKYGSGRILKIMQRLGVIDAVAIVSRW
jgi:putative IMPACT (imprinted ancient) family translation regulator